MSSIKKSLTAFIKCWYSKSTKTSNSKKNLTLSELSGLIYLQIVSYYMKFYEKTPDIYFSM